MAGSKNKSFWQRVQNGVRDVFDANTEDDQIRRQRAGQPRYYQQQQAQQRRPSYGSNPVSQVVNWGRDQVDANTAQDRAKRIAAGQAELQQKTFQAKYAPFLKVTPNDPRSLLSKSIDQFNPNDSGRTFANPGKQNAPNILQRNLSPTGVFNVGKEIVQGTAQVPINAGLSLRAEQQKNEADALDKNYQRLKSMSYGDRVNYLRNNPNEASLFQHDPTNSPYNPEKSVSV